MWPASHRAANACPWTEDPPPAPRAAEGRRLRSVIADNLLDRQFTAEAPNQRWIVLELSRLLDQLGTLTGATKTSTFRSPNGVYLKMMNPRAIDPAFTQQGKVGMSSIGRLEQEVWNEFAGRQEELLQADMLVRAIITRRRLPRR